MERGSFVGDAIAAPEKVKAGDIPTTTFGKTGVKLLGPVRISQLWSGFGGLCETNGAGDPVVLYDQLADRWVISEFAFALDSSSVPTGPFYECIAVSRTGDPAGSYFRYSYLTSETKMDDYPKLGVWPGGYFMTIDQFDSAGWAGVAVVARFAPVLLGLVPGLIWRLADMARGG